MDTFIAFATFYSTVYGEPTVGTALIALGIGLAGHKLEKYADQREADDNALPFNFLVNAVAIMSKYIGLGTFGFNVLTLIGLLNW